MKKGTRKISKTFPLEIDDDLHKALKFKAIETDQTLHAFIINTLVEKVQEEPAKYHPTNRQAGTQKEKNK